MLRKLHPLLYRNLSQLRSYVARAEIKPKSEKWDLYAGVLVERLPVISHPLSPLEQEFEKTLNDIEFEESLKSDHELRLEKDKMQAILLKKGEIEMDLDTEASKQTAQDLEDLYIEELAKFELSPRTTEADKKNDKQSLNRQLANTLYLMIEQKLGEEKHLLLPQGKRLDGETMRQTAERVLREQAGDNLNVFFYGNAPCGFYKYKYPKEHRNESVGAKIFFFRSAYQAGLIDKKAVKYEWLNNDEMSSITNPKYYHNVSHFLLQ